MVLVSYILSNYVSILQTKFSNREGHEARRIGLETMPLHQHIAGHHGEGQTRLKIRPHAVHDVVQWCFCDTYMQELGGRFLRLAS